MQGVSRRRQLEAYLSPRLSVQPAVLQLADPHQRFLAARILCYRHVRRACQCSPALGAAAGSP